MFFEKRQKVNVNKTLIKRSITLALSIDFQILSAHDGPTSTSVADHT